MKLNLNFYNKEYLPIELDATEKNDIKELVIRSKSFLTILKNKVNYTQTLLNEVNNIVHGKIPRSVILGFRGRIGRLTGIFKTSLMLQLAYSIDDNFVMSERLGFTPEQLISKVKKYGKRKQFFAIDEHLRDTKFSAWMRLANIMENCREKELSFLCAGVPDQSITYMDYLLERVGESNDKHLPKKTVLYAVKKTFQGTYRGFFKWNLIPLTNKKWKEIWDEYMEIKSVHQQKVMDEKVTGINYKEMADNLIVKYTKEKLKESKIKKLSFFIKIEYPDYTSEDREMIKEELRMQLI